jgi:hypothetical protein
LDRAEWHERKAASIRASAMRLLDRQQIADTSVIARSRQQNEIAA